MQTKYVNEYKTINATSKININFKITLQLKYHKMVLIDSCKQMIFYW